MKPAPTSSEILNQTREFLSEKGYNTEQEHKVRLDQVMEMLKTNRNSIQAIYNWQPHQGKGLLRKGKNFVLLRIKSIVINVLEKYITKQQKFNELTYQALVELQAENQQLKQKLSTENHGSTD